jgi:hypothetical protein
LFKILVLDVTCTANQVDLHAVLPRQAQEQLRISADPMACRPERDSILFFTKFAISGPRDCIK